MHLVPHAVVSAYDCCKTTPPVSQIKRGHLVVA